MARGGSDEWPVAAIGEAASYSSVRFVVARKTYCCTAAHFLKARGHHVQREMQALGEGKEAQVQQVAKLRFRTTLVSWLTFLFFRQPR